MSAVNFSKAASDITSNCDGGIACDMGLFIYFTVSGLLCIGAYCVIANWQWMKA